MNLDAAAVRVVWAMRGVLAWFLPRPWLLKLRERWYEWRFSRAARGFSPAEGLERARSYPQGINVVGYLHAESGVGEGARSSIRAALAAGVPVSTIDFRTGCPSRMEEHLPEAVPSGERYSVVLVHVNADEVPTVFLELGRGLFERHYTVGFWNWELSELPGRWASHASVFNEIWAPSAFVREAVAKSVKVPVHRVPFCVELPAPARLSREELGLPRKGFVFLTMFDALSIVERKNPLGAWRAFSRAVTGTGIEATLVVKVLNARGGNPVLRALREEATRHPSLVLLDRYLDRRGLTALLAECDSLVSLHRSEGFGLPLLEAMALGKPVIATGWSGNTDFMAADNSLPVEYRLRSIEESCGPYERGQTWAEPDLDHAAACMRRLMRDADLCRRIGGRAREDASAAYSPAAVGALIRERLRRH